MWWWQTSCNYVLCKFVDASLGNTSTEVSSSSNLTSQAPHRLCIVEVEVEVVYDGGAHRPLRYAYRQRARTTSRAGEQLALITRLDI